MLRTVRGALSLSLLAVVLGVGLACRQEEPAERVMRLRQQYQVTLNAFLPAEQLQEKPPADAGADAAEGGVDAAALDDVPPPIEGPQPTDILFDVIIHFEGRTPLPGITVDITHADAFENVKEERRHYIDTSGIGDDLTRQLSFVLGGWSYEPGDKFSLELRQQVPPEEQAEYREFQDAGS